MAEQRRAHKQASLHVKSTATALMVLTVLVMSPVSVVAESTVKPTPPPGQRDKALADLFRRVDLLETHLRENDRARDVLLAEIQQVKDSLMMLQSDGASRPNVGLTASTSTTGDTEQGQLILAQEAPAPDQPDHAQQDGVGTAGWDGGFYVASADRDFEFRPLGIIHMDFRGHDDARQINSGDSLSTTFDIRRLRLGFEGYLFKDIDYSIEVNLDEDKSELIYAYVDLGQIPSMHLRVGQFKEPFSYEVLYPEKYLDFIERANIVSTVGPAEGIGVMAHNFGHPSGEIFEYGLGVFNGNGIHLNDQQNDGLEVAARFTVLPFADGPAWLQQLKLAGNMTYTAEQDREAMMQGLSDGTIEP